MVQVRLAMGKDAAEVSALTEGVFAALRAIYVPQPASGRAERLGGEWMGVVAEDEGGIIRTVQFQERTDALHVKGLAVRADWRRRGVARGLVTFVAEEARRRGLGRVTLYTVKQTGNVGVFERLGFWVVREEADATVALVGGGVAVDVLMERRVEG
jgi:GNAT superfamily N-acetyltransferase